MKNNKSVLHHSNVAIAFVLAGLWAAVLVANGMVQVYSWTLLILVIPVIGLIYFLLSIAVVSVSALKRRGIRKDALFSILLGIAMITPFTITMGLTDVVYPASHDASSALIIPSPFKEDVLVAWGGDSARDNRAHVIWPSERYAYDLVMEPYDTGAESLEDYGIFGLETFSPVAGTVVASHDGEPDIPPNTESFTSLAGNHVYIRVESTGTYLLFAHFQNGTVGVSVGDEVGVGDYLGRIGNSGTTSEPHLHIQHQRQDPTKTIHHILAEGLPLLWIVNIEPDDNLDPITLTKGDILPRNQNFI